MWNLFSLGVLTGTGVIVNNAGIVKKVSFPREILALAAVGSACVFFFFQSIVMVVFMIVLHAGPDWAYLPLLVLALIAGVVLASALAVLLSSINVYLRDTQHLMEVILTAWFWACPIVYAFQPNIALKLGPKGLLWVYFLNPVTPLVLTFQRCIYNKVDPVALRQAAGREIRPSATRAPAARVSVVPLAGHGRPRPGRSSCSSSRWASSAGSRATSPRSSRR